MLFCGLTLISGEVVVAESSLADITRTVEKSGKWQSLNPVLLSNLVETASDPDARNTAKALLLFCLSDQVHKLPEAERVRMKELREQLVRDVPNSWQGKLAKFNAISVAGFEGNYRAQIEMIQTALKEWDFSALDNDPSEGMRAFRATVGKKPEFFRDALMLMLANALCVEDRISEAETVFESIHDKEFRKIIADRIKLAKKGSF